MIGPTDSNVGNRIRGMGCQYVSNILSDSQGCFLIRFSEGYQLAMHTLDHYRGTVVACRYCPPPSLARPEALAKLKAGFYDSIARIALAQPHLQVGITGENSKDPAFVRLDRLDLRNHVFWTSFDNSIRLETLYTEILQTQLDTRYDHLATQPGWRVVILHKIGAESMEVLYVWNHAHHDGTSGKIFHQNLLRNLNEIFLRNTEPVLEVSADSESWLLDLPDPSSRLPPNPEILTPWPMSPVFLLKCLWRELKPTWIFGPGPTHATWAPIRASPFATRFRNFTVDNDTVTKVVGVCRLHHTTLTGLIQALVLVSLTSALEDMKGFASITPYDLRHVLPSNTPQYPWLQPKESMCNYVSNVYHEFGSKLVESIRSKMPSQAKKAELSADATEIIWSVAAGVRREIKERLDSGIRNDWIAIMKFVSDWRDQQQSEAAKPRFPSWLVTNLGVLDGGSGNVHGQQEGWSLRRAELVLSAEVPSAAFSVSIMTVKGEEMCITCSWQDCVVDPGLGERLMGDLERWLNEIASSL